MTFKNLINRLLRRKRREDSHTNGNARQSRQAVQGILQKLQNTREDEYSCEETYRILDHYAELVERGEDASKIMPLVKHHLDMCPDCREELEALLEVLKNLPGQQ